MLIPYPLKIKRTNCTLQSSLSRVVFFKFRMSTASTSKSAGTHRGNQWCFSTGAQAADQTHYTGDSTIPTNTGLYCSIRGVVAKALLLLPSIITQLGIWWKTQKNLGNTVGLTSGRFSEVLGFIYFYLKGLHSGTSLCRNSS